MYTTMIKLGIETTDDLADKVAEEISRLKDLSDAANEMYKLSQQLREPEKLQSALNSVAVALEQYTNSLANIDLHTLRYTEN